MYFGFKKNKLLSIIEFKQKLKENLVVSSPSVHLHLFVLAKTSNQVKAWNSRMFYLIKVPGGGGTQICLDGVVPLKPQNAYPSLRVILAEKGTHC